MVSRAERIKGEGISVRRKIFHMLLGTVFILSMLANRDLRWFFLAVLAFGIGLSFIQERRPLPVISWFLDRYDKKGDEVPGQGPLTFFLGSVMVWFIFPEDIAVISLLVLAFGDPLAFLGGMMIGGPRLPWNKDKTYAGLLSFMVVPMLLISVLYNPIFGALAVITGGVAETLCLPEKVLTDDNFLVPASTAMVVWILSILFSLL
jgi:dolichol kinase